jgi:3-oxoacyl-[acyl-carrier protein] reductase
VSAGRLAARRAIVTGAASGFGLGIARAFAAEGARVVIADRDAETGAAAAAAIGPAAHAVRCDVADGASVAEMAEAALGWLGGLDILVNNAGAPQRPTPLAEVDEATFDRIAAVNMKAIYLTARALLPALAVSPAASILNIASTAGVSPRRGLCWYNASKAWVIGATRAMAIELAPQRIRVNAINPVAGETPMLADFMGGDTPEARARFLASIPMGRFSTPQDIAHAAVYLCSDEASLVTGVALNIDGGRCI